MSKYTTVVVDYEPRAPKMAEAIDAKVNEMADRGYELAAMTETPSARAILVFRNPRA